MNGKIFLGTAGVALFAGLAGAGSRALAQTSADADSPAAAAAHTGFSELGGAALYANICAACHMPAGEGAVGAGFYPALASNPRMIAKGYPLYVVVKGMNGMPPMADMMTDEQVADVVNYIRTNFGNSYSDAVSPAEVAALR
ncbi:c-type cytochrome [Alteraurantiacibacter palmitatis]|uniref:C-type cytochrome n=1 Tax=Alteraurantiacibacter palmitatis TaxID=2054628 RepID=A0ABV7EB26_9SPHN